MRAACGEFQGLAFSPDGRQLATVAGPDICVFGLPDGQLIRRLPMAAISHDLPSRPMHLTWFPSVARERCACGSCRAAGR